MKKDIKPNLSWEDKKKLCLYKGKSFLNETINSWKVIGFHSTKMKPSGSAVLWLCECLLCGNTKAVSPYNLFSAKSKSCFLCSMKSTKMQENHNWKGFGNIPRSIVTSTERNAKSRGFDFDIDGHYLDDLWKHQNKKCAITGLELIMDAKSKNRHPWGNHASVDRIDSKKGYIKGNIQWVHPIINMMKNHFPQDTFVQFCQYVTEHQKSL